MRHSLRAWLCTAFTALMAVCIPVDASASGKVHLGGFSPTRALVLGADTLQSIEATKGISVDEYECTSSIREFTDPDGRCPLCAPALAVWLATAEVGTGAAVSAGTMTAVESLFTAGVIATTAWAQSLRPPEVLVNESDLQHTQNVWTMSQTKPAGTQPPASTPSTPAAGAPTPEPPRDPSRPPDPKKVVNSNMGHAEERAVERAGFGSRADARSALQSFGSQLESNGLPQGAIKDPAHPDRVIVPGFGQGGAVVYQVKEGTYKLKTVLEWREPDL